MKKNTHLILFTTFVVTFLLVAAMTIKSYSTEKKGTITITNDTSKTLYIVIDDYNQGEVWANNSETYRVTIGEHKVQAFYGDKVTSKYIKLSDTYPDDTWCISNSQL